MPHADRRAVPAQSSRSVSRPFLRFYHSEELRARTLAVLLYLEESPDPKAHRQAFADVAVELMSAGMDYYILQPFKRAAPGLLTQQTANVGMAGAVTMIGTVMRTVILRMDGPQLRSLSGSLRRLMS
jgi:hypothetical protein